MTPESVTWRLRGASPGLARVSFEYSTDNVNYTPLGDGSFSGASWSLTGLNLPLNQNIYVRTRGNYNGGVGNASGSVVGAVRNVFFGSAATPTPTPVSSVTPMPSLTPTVAPTPTPIPTATPAQLPVCGLITDFENISSLPTEGWVSINDSTVVGGTGWFQGNAGVFSAQSGTPTSYIAANFYNEARPPTGEILPERSQPPLPVASATPAGTPTPTATPPITISNWLLTPPIRLLNGSVLTFYTRTVNAPRFPDRLQVRLSTSGASVDVGTNPLQVGDFTTLLLDINAAQTVSGYPSLWTQQRNGDRRSNRNYGTFGPSVLRGQWWTQPIKR